MMKKFSFTAATDWLFRLSFATAGLRSVTTDFGDGTVMHCWVPKDRRTDKPPLVLIHGFGANAMWQYRDLLRHFTSCFDVYVPDLLFFGGSRTTLPERSEAFQAQTVMRLMDALAPPSGRMKMRVVWMSYGGFVAYSLAAQFPGAVESLALCRTGVCAEEKDMTEGLFPVKDLDEAASILLPETPEKLRELVRISFYKPAKGVPSYFLSDFIETGYVFETRRRKNF